jgi:hypothetical protein
MNRGDIIDKYIEGGEPTKKELEQAYGYLNYCTECGDKIFFFDYLFFNVIHSFFGNRHRLCYLKRKERRKNDKSYSKRK